MDKVEIKYPICNICEKEVIDSDYGTDYCNECVEEYYDNKTGYCSFDCCMGAGCDWSC